MTATNHVLTGLVIGTVVHQPILAIPLAFASHFVCDALPHFGSFTTFAINKRPFAILLSIDCSVAALILLGVLIAQPTSWLLMIACGIAAASPDLMWLPKFIRLRRGDKRTFRIPAIMKFHGVIQWSQTLWGAIPELIWAGGMIYILSSLVN